MLTLRSSPLHAHRSARLAIGALPLLLALGLAAPSAAQEKNEREVVTSGPAVPLSPGQRAALESKRAATVQPARPVAPMVVKPSPVSTIGEVGSGVAPKAAPGPEAGPSVRTREARTGASRRVSPASAAAKTSAGASPRAPDDVRTALGPAAARAAGLAKSGDRVSTGAAKKEPRP